MPQEQQITSDEPLKFDTPDNSWSINQNKKLVFLPGVSDSSGSTPVRGVNKGTLTPEEIQLLSPSWDVHFRVFDLYDEKDKEDYSRLMTAAATYGFVQVFKELWPEVSSSEKFPVAVKWGERYLEPQKRGVFINTGDPLGN